MYHRKVQNSKLKIQKFRKEKSFTLIEVIVVMGVMGLIIGGLLVSMRQIIEGEMLLKRMQGVEEESRYIMDLFAQDAQYSDLEADFKPSANNDYFTYIAPFLLVEKKSQLSESGNNTATYLSYCQYCDIADKEQWFFERNITGGGNNLAVTLNNTPLAMQPMFRIRNLSGADGTENYMITISLVFQVDSKNGLVRIPIQTSVVSRTFEI